MRKFVALISAALLSAAALASPVYVVRGQFNGWGSGGDLVMTDMGGGLWTATATGLTPGQATEFKCTTPDWSFNAPGSNSKIVANAAGQITFHFYPATSWADGWNPSGWARVGYVDPGQFGWEIMGSFNGWSAPILTLTNLGGGQYAGEIALNAGSYEFKFRKIGDWGISIGSDFGNSAPNASLNVASNGDLIRFELDLPGGRWRTYLVPEPAAAVLLALGLALRRR